MGNGYFFSPFSVFSMGNGGGKGGTGSLLCATQDLESALEGVDRRNALFLPALAAGLTREEPALL